MQAYRIQTVLEVDGTVTLHHLPFQAGDSLEVIVLARPTAKPSSRPYPLRGTRVQYVEPTEPVAESDWGVGS